MIDSVRRLGPVRAGFSLRRAAKAGLLALAAVVTVAPVLAAPAPPDRQTQTIARSVRFLLEQKHISRQAIDDTISQRCLESFLESLDPLKLYFYQSDIDEFARNRDRLDDYFRSGNVDFAHTVFARFLARLEERVETALKWVDAEHDFTVDERMVTDADSATYPRTPEEASDRWRKRVKFDLMLKITETDPELAEGAPASEPLPGLKIGPGIQLGEDADLSDARVRLRKRYSSLRKRWNQTSSDELLELYVTALTSGFDPHSSYMSPSTLENFNIQMRLELDGIGASLRSDDGYTEVAEVIAGGAADQEGSLTKGDKIVGVGQNTEGPMEDIVDMKLNDVVKLIRGKRGTIVRLQVKPVDNPNDLVEYIITRDRIELKNQEARSVIIEGADLGLPPKANGQPYRLGVIDLPSFYMDMEGARAGLPNYKSVTRDVRRLLDGFDKEAAAGRPIDAVVVDLRFNGGGSLTEAVNLTGLFIDQGPVVQVKGTDGRTIPYADDSPGMMWDGPLVVLTNRFSASASEIFAGAVQDYGRGIVVGDESTHGKGTVQQLFDLGNKLFGRAGNLGALKMTIQQFYRPGGDSTQNRGVLADIRIPALTDHLEGITEAEMDYALAFDRVRALRHDFHGMAGGQIASQLQSLSDERVSRSEDFADDLKKIDKYETQKDNTDLTLNLSEFLAEREELDEDKEKKEMGEQMSDSDKPVFDLDDHYNREAMSITIDYVRLLQANKLAIAR
ncbi:Tail-specific protease precursor [Planctomycetes bacterium MalM25]|nr:Tail-specific protease precursor [Planctomycetes bacterium MalM25]